MNHLIRPNTSLTLSDLPTRSGDQFNLSRKETEAEFKQLRKELRDWQYKWYAEGKRKLLIVLQALDAGGKDGTIRNMLQGVNPQGVVVTSFKAPSKIELAHDYLWRIHHAVPAAGMWGVFNRSHYEDVLIVRVQNFVPESVWRPRYEQINQFEQLLSATGTTILKFYLHISKDEQKERLQARLDTPEKRWKFDAGDLKQRARWDDYMTAFEDVFRYTSTEYAPWYVIPADQKWYRNYAITKIVVEKLRELNPRFPEAQAGIENLQIV
ncbi:MAG TPA: polyphosphate kinase 2 family protein [Anaerolineae bacterium]|nr:polyphosphate kinase 2 family protein [Anaerolineae bacterium]